MTITDYIKRIEYFTAQTLIHIQAENLDKILEDLKNIQTNVSMVQKLIEKIKWITSQGGISSEGFGL